MVMFNQVFLKYASYVLPVVACKNYHSIIGISSLFELIEELTDWLISVLGWSSSNHIVSFYHVYHLYLRRVFVCIEKWKYVLKGILRHLLPIESVLRKRVRTHQHWIFTCRVLKVGIACKSVGLVVKFWGLVAP